jgi:hypothetical protein
MSGRTTLYTFSIEGMEGTVNIVAYTITDAENTLKEWLNPGVKIKLLHKDKVTLGKEYRKLNTQDTPAIDISTNPNTPNVWKELYDRYKLNSLVDDLNVIDTRDEIDTKEEIKKGDRDFMYK